MRIGTAVRVGLLCIAFPTRAFCQEKCDWKCRFREGVAAYTRGDYCEAANKFGDSYFEFPSPHTLPNLGHALKECGRSVDAANAYQQYLDSGEKDETIGAQVKEFLDDISKRVGGLRIDVGQAGAAILVDGVDVGEGPFLVRWVTPGTHGIVVTKPGFLVARTTVSAVAGHVEEVSLELAAEPIPVSAIPSVPEGPVGRPPEVTWSHDGNFRVHLRVDVDTGNKGVGGVLEGMYGASGYVDIRLAGVFAENSAVRLLASIYPWPAARLKPALVAGAAAFFADGVRLGPHIGLGLVVDLTEAVGVSAEFSVEHFPDMPDAYSDTLWLAGVGVHLRML